MDIDSCEPSKCLSIHGLDGFETFKLDEKTIGVRPIWFDVNDRLPDLIDSEYLVFVQGNHGRKRIKLCKWVGVKSIGRILFRWLSSSFSYKEVTHWMPIPKPPGE